MREQTVALSQVRPFILYFSFSHYSSIRYMKFVFFIFSWFVNFLYIFCDILSFYFKNFHFS